jgi:predicted dehydrogenase
MGALHAEKIARHPGAMLVAVVDRDATRARELAARHGARSGCEMGSFLPDVEGVVIAVAPFWHAALAEECVLAGKAIIVEKPLAHTAAAARELVELVMRRGSVARVGHGERFCPAYASVRGRVASASAIHCERTARARERGWPSDPVRDLMIHDIETLLRTNRSGIQELRAVAGRDRHVQASLRFGNGQSATLRAGYVSDGSPLHRRLTAQLEGQSLEVDWLARTVSEEGEGQRIRVFAASRAESDVLAHEQADFIAAIRGTAPRHAGVDSALAAVECAESIRGLLTGAQ